jgi:hypothetical protein
VSIDGKAQFDVARYLAHEKAVMMVEIYRHGGAWKLGTIAQGFDGGLAALITHLGGEVAPDTPSPAPSPAPKVSLTKITLEKSRPTVSLTKTGASFGQITLNLNWNQRSGPTGFFGRRKGIDLDLVCSTNWTMARAARFRRWATALAAMTTSRGSNCRATTAPAPWRAGKPSASTAAISTASAVWPSSR